MQKIQSFQIDHDVLDPGIYVSRIDGDVTTYDLRTRKPNSGDVMDNVTMHSVEHMIATFVRNSSIADRVIYFGPMGCQTGFYLSTMNNVTAEDIAIALKAVYEKVFPISSTDDIVGLNEVQCGNPALYAIEETNEAMAKYIKVLFPEK